MNILITRHDKIGDFITTLPLFFVVKRAFPQAKIIALVSRINVELAQQIDFIDEVILYDQNQFWQTLKNIKTAHIDTSISAFIDTQLGWLLFLSGIKTRISPATKIAQLFFNKTIKQKRSLVEKTEVLYNLDLAILLKKNINLAFDQPLLRLTGCSEFFKKNPPHSKKIVLFHPGYGGSSDGNLTLKNYVELASIARKIKNIQIIWIFGPDDLEAKEKIKNLMPQSDMVYQPSTLLDYCFLIRDSELLISTSTGPMHLAGALNIKTISFFGSNLFASPKRWATVSETCRQHNFIVNKKNQFKQIEKSMLATIC
jgi:ADP-heptose:LPS heptosyltransferase